MEKHPPQLDHKHVESIQGDSRSIQTDLLGIIAHLLIDMNDKLDKELKQAEARAKKTDELFVKAMPMLDNIGAWFLSLLSQMGPTGPPNA